MPRGMKPALIALAALTAAGAAYLLTRDAARLSTPSPYTLKDDEGAVLTLKEPPRRVVTLGPHFTETLHRIGAGSLIVGGSGADTAPAEATGIPSVLDDDGQPNTVRIGELAPDLVITTGPDRGGYKSRLRAAGIDVVTLDATGIEDALADLEKVGRLVGRARRAERMVAGMRAALDASSTAGETRVFVEAHYPPLFHTGSKGFLADIVARAGAVLVAPSDLPAETTAEGVSALSPDIYLAGSATASADEIPKRPGFSSIPAVAAGRVSVIADDLLFYPGPRMVEAVETIRNELKRHGRA